MRSNLPVTNVYKKKSIKSTLLTTQLLYGLIVLSFIALSLNFFLPLNRNINTLNNEELIKEPSQNNADDWEQLMGIYRVNLSNHLETPVKITKNQNGKGKIVIHYEDEDSLADIVKNKILK